MNNKEIAETLYNFVLHEYIEKKIGNETTYDSELSNFCNELLGSKFAGVFPSDKIPKLTNKKPYCILNLDRSDQSGSHWVSLCYDNGAYLFYDSFGRKNTKIINSLSKTIKTIIKDSELDAEQNIMETNCGQRSISFLLIHDMYGKEYSKYI